MSNKSILLIIFFALFSSAASLVLPFPSFTPRTRRIIKSGMVFSANLQLRRPFVSTIKVSVVCLECWKYFPGVI